MKILAINPGSTSTKVALFENEEVIFQQTLRHSNYDLAKFVTLKDQIPFRRKLILEFLKTNNVNVKDIAGFIGRGGLMKPLKSGIYKVNALMREHLSSNEFGTHASNLGGLLAYELASKVGKDAFIADPVVVDEMSSVAKISG